MRVAAGDARRAVSSTIPRRIDESAGCSACRVCPVNYDTLRGSRWCNQRMQRNGKFRNVVAHAVIIENGEFVQSLLVGGMIISTTVTAAVLALRKVSPVVCPVCNGDGGQPCVSCSGTGLNSSSSSVSGSGNTIASMNVYGFDVENSLNPQKGANINGSRSRKKDRECKRCLGSGTKLCKTCDGTGFVSRL